jgi:Malectin domain
VTSNIYCSSRYFVNASYKPARYNLPVPTSGDYLLRLHFAEQFFSATNRRKFDVNVEGQLVINELDIFATAPGKDVPLILSFGTTVVDGNVTIQFLPGAKNNPQINGIEVISLGPPVASPTNAPIAVIPTLAPTFAPISNATFEDILINCGGECRTFMSTLVSVLHPPNAYARFFFRRRQVLCI